MSGCAEHEWFDEGCETCALSVSRPMTKNDLPSPFDSLPVGAARDLVISPTLIEDAKRAGQRRIAAEHTQHQSLKKARDQLCKILKDVWTASGQLHISDKQAALGDVKVIPYNATVNGVTSNATLLQLWELIPQILKAHIKNCEFVAQKAEKEATQSDAIFQGGRAIRALIGTSAPEADKIDFIQKAMTDHDVFDALTAADDSGIPHAAFDVIRQQVGVPTENTYTDLFMAHLVEAFGAWADKHPDDSFVLLFCVAGVGDWAFIPPNSSGTGEMDMQQSNTAHWRLNADLVLDIDAATFEHVLLHIPSAGVATALMNQYFNGKLTINGGSASEPEGIETHFVKHVGTMFAAAHNRFSFDVSNMADEQDRSRLADEVDIPF